MYVRARHYVAALLMCLFLAGASAFAAGPAAAAPRPVSVGSQADHARVGDADGSTVPLALRRNRATTRVIFVGGGAVVVAVIAAAMSRRRGGDQDREPR